MVLEAKVNYGRHKLKSAEIRNQARELLALTIEADRHKKTNY